MVYHPGLDLGGCHVMSLRHRCFATVGCADGLVPTNALCLLQR